MTPTALTIAGSDPSGGAGIQADLKTFRQHGVYGMSVITLLTVQNTRSVDAVRHLDPEFVVAQLDAVLCDIPPHAAKTGALGSAAIIQALAERAAEFEFPLLVDPVMISKHGATLLDDDAIESLKSRLLPHAFCVTPNLPEAAALTGIEVTDRSTMEQAARAIAELGPKHVLIKGGHLDKTATPTETQGAAGFSPRDAAHLGAPEESRLVGSPRDAENTDVTDGSHDTPMSAVDVLWSDGRIHEFAVERIDSKNTHGTGCVFSAAITARLACGEPIIDAIRGAKRFITTAIRTAPQLGGGAGPTNMHAHASE